MFTWLSFGSALPSKVAQFSVGANNHVFFMAVACWRRCQGSSGFDFTDSPSNPTCWAQCWAHF
ncbi:hypothetical protein CBP34_15450 [Acidovorax carolinensis]|uniref:Uncharacterized protein n=1 Tax=Acidovorax carolinensis TaxID=553814 RepID=A0A240U4N7_9BURK|nr:hypothetical protein CBP34_15450 [Acidovorax carolinensis]